MDDSLADLLLDLLAPLGDIRARRMFGGQGIYHESTMFAIIADDAIYMRVAEQDRPRYAERGMAPFRYSTKKGVIEVAGLWQLPPELLDEPDEVIDWARGAIATAEALKAAKPPKKRRAAKPRARRAKPGAV